MDLTSLSLIDTRQLLIDQQVTPREVADAYLQRIARLDPRIQSYLYTATPAQIDTQLAAMSQGPLHGIPVAHKDVFCTTGMPSTGASRILANYIPPYNATIVDKLQQAGTLTLGKVNCDEFAMGGSTENSAYAQTRNPHDLTRVPGGSSGGSAAAVAADLCAFATATDTGGSIRQPSSFCGTVGLKVTYGRVSRYGAMAMASSLDTISVITKTVPDAALVLQSIAGHDIRDATTSTVPVPDYTAALTTGVAGKRIGVPREYFGAGLDPQVDAVIQAALQKYEQLGAHIVPISLPHTEYAMPAYYLIVGSEVSANMARYDGIRYGPTASAHECDELTELYIQNRTAGFGNEVKRRIMLGTFALSAGYADKFYKKALQTRTLIKRDFDEAFQQVDCIMTPVAPTVAFPLGDKTEDPLQMYLADVFTIPASLAGIAGISIPSGFVDHLPVGLQILGPQWSESMLLATAHAYESATTWRRPLPLQIAE